MEGRERDLKPRLGIRSSDSSLISIGLAQRLDTLSLSLADLRRVCEGVLHTVPDVQRNFDTVSARPRDERNMMRPYLAAHGGDRVAERRDGFRIPCSRPDVEFLRLCELVREQGDDREQ